MTDDMSSSAANIDSIYSSIRYAQLEFARLLSESLVDGASSRDQYIRYLSFQYHLTKDVQRYFLEIAGHPDLARRRQLRAFLVNFANEEELHYLVAANDLHLLGVDPLPAPVDVLLWHAYFRSVVSLRPFVRLGAATILENISGGEARPWVKRALSGPFLTRSNTKFLVLHQHETLPHGDQIMEAIASANLEARHFADLLTGARIGTILYLRMAEWAAKPLALSRVADAGGYATADAGPAAIDEAERLRIRDFKMAELEQTEDAHLE